MTRRRRPVWPLAGVSLCLLASPANAAPQRRDTGPLFTQVDTGQGAAAAARALAARGACGQALASFDIALRSSIDMTIRRDRGLCHEQLGHPYPAMDDYRAYLTVSPDAPDSPDIRARLERLEIQTGVGGPSANGPATSPEDVPAEAARINDTSIQTSDTGLRSRLKQRITYDVEESAYHEYDRAMTSPLRRGSGAIFALYTDNRAVGFGTGGAGVGADYQHGFEVGASIRWSFDSLNTLYGQIGYAGYELGGLASTVNIGGLALAVGYELRLRLDQYASNQIILGPAFEYQYIVEGSTGASAGAFSSPGQGINILFPQGRIGYRHVFGYGVGLEFVFHAGETLFVASQGPVEASRAPVLGGTIALALAF